MLSQYEYFQDLQDSCAVSAETYHMHALYLPRITGQGLHAQLTEVRDSWLVVPLLTSSLARALFSSAIACTTIHVDKYAMTFPRRRAKLIRRRDGP